MDDYMLPPFTFEPEKSVDKWCGLGSGKSGCRITITDHYLNLIRSWISAFFLAVFLRKLHILM